MTKAHPPPTPKTDALSAQNQHIETELSTLLPILLGDDTIPTGFESPQHYLAMLDSFSMDKSDKLSLIHTLQTLIETIVGIRFGVDPVTLELKDRGEKLASDSVSVLKSTTIKNTPLDGTFTSASSAHNDDEQGGMDERI